MVVHVVRHPPYHATESIRTGLLYCMDRIATSIMEPTGRRLPSRKDARSGRSQRCKTYHQTGRRTVVARELQSSLFTVSP